MSDINVNNSSGIGALGLLCVVLITLKLMGIIHWSWLIVVCSHVIVWLVVIGGCTLIAGIVAALDYMFTTSSTPPKKAAPFKLG